MALNGSGVITVRAGQQRIPQFDSCVASTENHVEMEAAAPVFTFYSCLKSLPGFSVSIGLLGAVVLMLTGPVVLLATVGPAVGLMEESLVGCTV